MKEHPILFSGGMIKAILDGRKTMTRRIIKYRAYAEVDRLVHPHECPYGQPGDQLWVKETWMRPFGAGKDECRYRADGEQGIHDWFTAIFMPRWASRITLEITAVQVERLQDISEEDAEAEGFAVVPYQGVGDLPSDRFRHYWDSLNAKRGYGWDANPWVWVIQFKRVGGTA